MKTLALLLIFLSLPIHSSVEEFANTIAEARVLVEARDYLKVVKEELSQGLGLDRRKLSELEITLEKIGKEGCDCPSENLIIRAQAYALVGAINGVISKETRSISHGKKSYHTLARARQLDPRNIDAIRGQAEALKRILKEGAILRTMAAVTLGINIKSEKRKLIKDLRTFKDHPILLKLADQLERI